MNLVSSTLLLSAGLLASPALAEVTRLRGSAAKADMAAEEDRAALRALQDAFSVPLPEFQDLPDGVGLMQLLPPGTVITSRMDEVNKVLETKSSRAGEITFFNAELIGNPNDPDAFVSTFENQKVARAGSASEFQNQQIFMEPDSNGFKQEFRQKNIAKRGNVAGEASESELTLAPGFAYGYYYGGKVAGTERASEFREQAIAADNDGVQASYYYEVQKDAEEFALEGNSHEYALQFSFSLPATTIPPP